MKANTQNLCRIYLVDKSDSVFIDSDRLEQAIIENIKYLNKNNLVGIVDFAEFSNIIVLPLRTTEVRSYLQKLHLGNSSHYFETTNIEEALLLAKGLFPSGYYKQIFLFSDGNETQGDAKKVISVLKQEGITLYTIPIGPNEVQDIKIDNVEAPKFVREGEPIELKCRVSSTINTQASIEILGNGKLIKKLEGISLLKNQDSSIVITLPAQSEPVQVYEVTVSTEGLDEIMKGNNYGKAVVQKLGKPKIACVSEAENLSQRTIYSIIKSNNDFEIQIVRFPTWIWEDEHGIVSKIGVIPFDGLYDIIILEDVSLVKNSNYENIQSLMELFVSNGGGLLVVGGQDSFGSGDYQNSSLEDILPVWASPSEDLCVVIILDASGSMDEPFKVGDLGTKFAFASLALENSLSLLGKTDRLEVIVFNQGYETLLPLKPIGEGIAQLKNKLRNVKPTGPTAIAPPIQKAITTLTNTTSAKKHIILLSDGHSTTDEPLEGFKEIAEKLQQNNITISAIATGEHINEKTLRAITKDESIGKIYRLSGKSSKEAKELTTRNLRDDLSVNKEFYRESDSLPVHAHIKDDILKGIADIPAISGYNRTTLKHNARLVTSVSKDNEVLIADWHYGLGKVMVLTTSLDSQWLGQWQNWSDLGKFITQALRYLSPVSSGETPTNIYTEELPDKTVRLTVEIPADGLYLIASIGPLAESSGTKPITPTMIKIPQIAVGRYETTIEIEDSSLVTIFSQSDNKRELVGRIPIVSQYSKEWRKFTPDMLFLRNLSEATGGRIIQPETLRKESIRNITADRSTTYQNINNTIILFVLTLFLLDLVVGFYYKKK